jgi:hypothetical protein
MSTRAIFHFTDGERTFSVYKHSDGYPDGPHGAIVAIARTLSAAWPLPRFEPDDFAAAFVASNYSGGGSIRLMNSPNTIGGLAYIYVITTRNDELFVQIEDCRTHEYVRGSLVELQSCYKTALIP